MYAVCLLLTEKYENPLNIKIFSESDNGMLLQRNNFLEKRTSKKWSDLNNSQNAKHCLLNVFVESVAKQYAFDVMPQRKVFEMFYICNGALQPKTSFGRSIVITIIIAYILRQFAVTCSTTTATATLMCFQCSILCALQKR